MKSAPITLDALAKRLAALRFSASESVLRDLPLYLSLLMKWNKAMNLVGIRT
jgi:16S rRNA G527 N7-methylase RsmG